jgi:hypothetical protein
MAGFANVALLLLPAYLQDVRALAAPLQASVFSILPIPPDCHRACDES